MQLEPPTFACNLAALAPEDRTALTSDLLPKLRGSDREVTELENGYRIRFLGGREIVATVTAWLSIEARCCPFFELSLSVPAVEGPLTVRISGPDGVKEFIREELASLLSP
jgi:hypothetical protein